MFSDEELEIIEDIVLNYGDQWAETSVDHRKTLEILDKIDRYLNG